MEDTEITGDDSPEEIIGKLEEFADGVGMSRTEVLRAGLAILNFAGLNAVEFHTLRDDA